MWISNDYHGCEISFNPDDPTCYHVRRHNALIGEYPTLADAIRAAKEWDDAQLNGEVVAPDPAGRVIAAEAATDVDVEIDEETRYTLGVRSPEDDDDHDTELHED